MRCPTCGNHEDKVVDSRVIEDGRTIRRRRECISCQRRFSTFERIEEVPLVVIKRSGIREPFDRGKLFGGIAAALKNRPFDSSFIEATVADIEERFRLASSDVNSSAIGIAVLDVLRQIDKVGYLRFASVYKDFEDPDDFEKEVASLKIDLEL
ncbi:MULTISPECIES: transcriptional regulator NrdR [Acidithrix]|uniref:Transcriptional repressor NrdR n=1 Tax=Acidithrix ferrooxidans TaxID=1280514 RepID=A0A0D8HMN6_9ACTN|nr:MULTISPECIES: transcriptional regulator NrdR [Acidithrix]KJF19017.1 transcriptional repressor NrdR [Acidithrix ferrooxidans]